MEEWIRWEDRCVCSLNRCLFFDLKELRESVLPVNFCTAFGLCLSLNKTLGFQNKTWTMYSSLKGNSIWYRLCGGDRRMYPGSSSFGTHLMVKGRQDLQTYCKYIQLSGLGLLGDAGNNTAKACIPAARFVWAGHNVWTIISGWAPRRLSRSLTCTQTRITM